MAGNHGAGGGIARAAHIFPGSTRPVCLHFLRAGSVGTGYLLTKHSNLIADLLPGESPIAAGLTGGLDPCSRFMSRLLQDTEAQMNEWDYRHEGSVGRVSISIPAGGTGEVIFEQHGGAAQRRPRGVTMVSRSRRAPEVVISRYEKGMAYVRKWDDTFTGEKFKGLKNAANSSGRVKREVFMFEFQVFGSSPVWRCSQSCSSWFSRRGCIAKRGRTKPDRLRLSWHAHHQRRRHDHLSDGGAVQGALPRTDVV